MKKILFIFMLISTIASGQENILFQTRNTPQSYLVNPALVPENARFFITMPIFGNINANITSSTSYSDIFTLASGKTIINPQTLLNSLDKDNSIRTLINLDIFNLGFGVGKNGFMGVSLRARTSLNFTFTKDAVEFIMDNPLEKMKTFNIGFTPDALGWGEFGVSYTHTIANNFNVGVRLKGIMGGVSAQAEKAVIIADKHLDHYNLQGNINLMTGNLNLSDNGENTFDFKNLSPGFAIDLGFSYLSDNKRIKAYASASDIGKIFWNEKSSTQIKTKNPNASYRWTGVKDINSLINQTSSFKDIFDNTIDEMTSVMGVDTIVTNFTSNIPMVFQVGGRYSVDEDMKHNITFNTMIAVPQYAKTYAEVSAGYTYSTLNKRWDLFGSYTYKTLNPFNIGIGGLYRGSGFEIFLMTDSINSFIDYKKARSANVVFGMNFYVPKSKRKSKKKESNTYIWK